MAGQGEERDRNERWRKKKVRRLDRAASFCVSVEFSKFFSCSAITKNVFSKTKVALVAENH